MTTTLLYLKLYTINTAVVVSSVTDRDTTNILQVQVFVFLKPFSSFFVFCFFAPVRGRDNARRARGLNSRDARVYTYLQVLYYGQACSLRREWHSRSSALLRSPSAEDGLLHRKWKHQDRWGLAGQDGADAYAEAALRGLVCEVRLRLLITFSPILLTTPVELYRPYLYKYCCVSQHLYGAFVSKGCPGLRSPSTT